MTMCGSAEQVDTNMAVRVKFNKSGDDGDADGSDEDSSFTYYFAEEELDNANK